ncbi:DUF2000 domain-containing protein [Bremerella sp. T1]|uniref:DUF2000 domain-containing protein n=1 Tax=Bremerella sp. TYQ1 TaxID=3119568 RepID=UPI001CCA15F5|nr:DUF2000 domain-containing protein [Bremerella volcania]UBM36624.1 DUF2000 family protein [Bremerella volcania]
MSNISPTDLGSPTTSQPVFRLAVILHKSLSGGSAANVAAIIAGGLKCEAFGPPIMDKGGNAHASIRWNMPILKAKTNGQLQTLMEKSTAHPGVESVAFCDEGRLLSNNFAEYHNLIQGSEPSELSLLAVGVFGSDKDVRDLTRAFSLYQ